jgi:hypothetical protein
MSEIKKDEYEIIVKPDFNPSMNLNRIYSNFVSVSHDPFSFIISFCDAHFENISKDKLAEKDETGAFILKAPIISQVIIPAGLMEKFIEACKQNLEVYNRKK